jgi:hypothetical protein
LSGLFSFGDLQDHAAAHIPGEQLHLLDRCQPALFANMPNFILDKDDDTEDSLYLVEGMYLYNDSSNAAAGCIRMMNGENFGIIRDCAIVGYTSVLGKNVKVDTCQVFSPTYSSANRRGIVLENGSVTNSAVTGWQRAIVVCGDGCVVENNRIEVNDYGIIVGENSAGDASEATGVTITGNGSESNNRGIWLRNVSGGLVAANEFHGFVGASPNGVNATTGGDPVDGLIVTTCSYVGFIGNSISMYVTHSGFDISTVTGAYNHADANIGAVTGGGGTAWLLTANGVPNAFTFGANRGLTPTQTVDSLPGTEAAGRFTGLRRNVYDASAAASGNFAATVGSGKTITGGSNNQLEVRWDGGEWRVVG